MSAQPDPLWGNDSREPGHIFGMPLDSVSGPPPAARVEPVPTAGERPRAVERLEAAAVATTLLAQLHEDVWQLSGDQLGHGVGVLWRLRQVIEGQLVAGVQEAMTRGDAGSRAKDWLTVQIQGGTSVPVDPGDVAALVAVAEATRVDGARAHPERAVLRDAVVTGRVSLRRARVCTDELARIQPLLQPGFIPAAWDLYAQLARTGTLPELRQFRPHLIARYGADDALAREQEKAHEHAALYAPVHDGPLASYRMRLDPEQQAVLEAAVGALSAPIPGPDGEPDDRPVARRRAEALIEIIRRGIAAGNSTPVTSKAAMFLTLPLADLTDGTGAAEVVGTTAAGTLLSPDTARRLACDGLILPTVVGPRGELLDLGRALRLFTIGQKRALLFRDRTCTFPGCDRPATWCDSHHLVHWVDGGPTDLANAALLCSLHHHTVHSRRLWGWVDDTGAVCWDLTPGRYDRELPTWRQQQHPEPGPGITHDHAPPGDRP